MRLAKTSRQGVKSMVLPMRKFIELADEVVWRENKGLCSHHSGSHYRRMPKDLSFKVQRLVSEQGGYR